MSVPSRASTFIRKMEGCELTAYQDKGGTWTIGWGRTKGVMVGDTCTQDEADTWLVEDMVEATIAVERLTVPLTESMRAAFISFAYNIGTTKFLGSDAYKAAVLRKYLDVPKHLLDWRLLNGTPNLGLVRRRLAEGILFLEDGVPNV
jgi:lysozyme